MVAVEQLHSERPPQGGACRSLLPPPDWPTRATILPGGSVRVKSSSTWRPGRLG